MKKIFLSKSVLENQSLTDEGLIVYIALRHKYEYKTDLILYDYISYLLTGQVINSGGMITKIKEGINNLYDLKLINKISESKKGVELNIEPLYFETKPDSKKFNHFIIINQSEIRIIMNSDTKFKFKLLRYFIAMIGTINNSSHTHYDIYCANVGNSPISYLSELANISESTALDYNKKLEELKLIVVHRSKEAIVDEEGKIQSGFTNCYGRPEHDKEIQNFQTYREKSKGNLGIKNISKDANYRRRMSQYAINIEKGKKYDKKIIKEVYSYFKKENENYDTELRKIKERYKTGKISENQMTLETTEFMKSRDKTDLTYLEKLLDDKEEVKEVKENKVQEYKQTKSNTYLEDIFAELGI